MSLFSHIADDSFSSWFAARTNRDRDTVLNVNNNASDGNGPSVGEGYPTTETEFPNAGVEVEKVFLYPKENAGKNYTQKYELVTEQNVAVIRRAAKFNVAIKTKSREINLNKDKVNLIFEFGKNASVPKGTKVVLPISKESDRRADIFNRWNTTFVSNEGNTLVVTVGVKADAPVGIWKCKVETSLAIADRAADKALYTHPEPVYILFNPYSKYDVVYMEDEELRKEYIENDVGKVWQGSWRRYSGKPWVLGQFDDAVLPACCFVLQKSKLRPGERGNAVKVARAISAMVNSSDDGGIITGKWGKDDGRYDDGTAPWDWTGSVAIIEQYMKNKGTRPVEYGQCWVFSAMTITVCRALGIPCRSITNFVSAHDTHENCTIDTYFDEDGEKMGHLNSDSVWNFHVWNDVWMARPDLPKGYDGWQVIDATPQESSDGKYQCGPCPVEAVRKGEIGIGFDTPFVFAEVNADKVNYVKDRSSSWGFRKTQTNETSVGRLLLTKAPGKLDRYGMRDAENVTHQYKDTEFSSAERQAVSNAMRAVARGLDNYEVSPGEDEEEQEEVRVALQDIEKVQYGESFKATIKLENPSSEIRTLKATISCSSVSYNGSDKTTLKKANGEFKLEPGEETSLAMTIDPEHYMGKLFVPNLLQQNAIVTVKETGQHWTGEDDFTMEQPNLDIEVKDKLTAGKFAIVSLSFTNPLNVPLTNCKVNLECSGAIYPMSEKVEDVESKGEFKHAMTLNPRRQPWWSFGGEKTMVAVFSSNEMKDVNGSAEVEVSNP